MLSIFSFKNKGTADINYWRRSREALRLLPEWLQHKAQVKLARLGAAAFIEDFLAIRGHRFEALSGQRKGHHSLRINDQNRACFRKVGVFCKKRNMIDHSQIIRRLCDCGYHAYLVGGAARDMLSGKDPQDVDIVTNAAPEEIELLFQGHHVRTVGKSFGVVLVDGFEVATFRKDRYAGLSDKACQVNFVENIDEDLSRRDLTINAMAFCDQSGDLIDPDHGREDLNRTFRNT